MKYRLPMRVREGVIVPPKYMDVLDALRDGPLSARDVGVFLADGLGASSYATSLAHGRLKSLHDVGAVERIEGRPLRWRLTPSGEVARYR